MGFSVSALSSLQYLGLSSANLSKATDWVHRGGKDRCKQVRWIAPTVGYWIVNCDGAFNLLSKEVGIGVIIRDSMAALVAEKGRSFLASSTLEVEALAMHEGGGCAFSTGWIHPIFSGSYSELR
ncbi:hypothetical protein ES288_D13G182200v1 [Gossypium darwinii]|uniref:RNase H type-1 domain-containing protein n=1 Tax=Gossypium darwinii TaxID=34276 RepID=A0A5D1ZZA8_GOSDA|nr:hypothetical protein ES288_D13G182200v1 [Gossypium darwinii]